MSRCKQALLALAVTILPLQAYSQTTFSSSDSVSYLASNIGSKVAIQLQSSRPSFFSGTFAQTFSYQNGVTNSTRNFNFVGSTNYNIVSTFNSTPTTFTNNSNFKW